MHLLRHLQVASGDAAIGTQTISEYSVFDGGSHRALSSSGRGSVHSAVERIASSQSGRI